MAFLSRIGAFWFTLTPPALASSRASVWGSLAVVAIIAAVILRSTIRRRGLPAFREAPWIRVARLLSVSGALLLALLFFRYEGIPFFGARFWLLFLVMGDLVWIGAIVRHVLVVLPKQCAAWEADQTKRKYLR